MPLIIICSLTRFELYAQENFINKYIDLSAASRPTISSIGDTVSFSKILVLKSHDEFVIRNVMKLNLKLPGSGNIVYGFAAAREPKLTRALAFASGLWSVYNTASYIYEHADKDKNTPSRARNLAFLASYAVGNILIYIRIIRYNRKIAENRRAALILGAIGNNVFLNAIYQFDPQQ